MKVITESKEIEQNLTAADIQQYFDSSDIVFSMRVYSKGEFLSQPFVTVESYQFVIKGELSVYYVKEDGNKYSLAYGNCSKTVGDIELVHDNGSPIYAEAISDVTTIAISLDKYRDRLLNDKCFMRFLLKNLAERLIFHANEGATYIPLQERVLNYMKYHCKDSTLSGVEKASFNLLCSASVNGKYFCNIFGK